MLPQLLKTKKKKKRREKKDIEIDRWMKEVGQERFKTGSQGKRRMEKIQRIENFHNDKSCKS